MSKEERCRAGQLWRGGGGLTSVAEIVAVGLKSQRGIPGGFGRSPLLGYRSGTNIRTLPVSNRPLGGIAVVKNDPSAPDRVADLDHQFCLALANGARLVENDAIRPDLRHADDFVCDMHFQRNRS